VRPAGGVNGDKMGGNRPPIGRTTAKTASNLNLIWWHGRGNKSDDDPSSQYLLAISEALDSESRVTNGSAIEIDQDGRHGPGPSRQTVLNNIHPVFILGRY